MTVAELLEQIRFARWYTTRLLDATPTADWWTVPTAGVSHIAWQVGHLAMAAYRLGLDRVRGRLLGDAELIGDEFLALFGRESNPDPDPAHYPPLEEIRAVYDRVHARVQEEVPAVNPDDLDRPLVRPHSLASTPRGCLAWCAQHELIHAGQIGLLRRQLGHAPLW
jgi:uncharacterized damage-inducible protein DinB